MSAQITINVAGDERSVDQGTTAADLFEGDRAVLVARVNGELRDLAHELAILAEVESAGVIKDALVKIAQGGDVTQIATELDGQIESILNS